MPMRTKEEQREYQRKWMAKRRADYFKDKVCVNCGSSDSLELDHINPNLKFTHNIWSLSNEKRNAELSKCQILCHECHVKKTAVQNNYGLKHGTDTGYTKYKCRCRPCTDAAVSKVRMWRATTIKGMFRVG